jgi:hypothetical protein
MWGDMAGGDVIMMKPDQRVECQNDVNPADGEHEVHALPQRKSHQDDTQEEGRADGAFVQRIDNEDDDQLEMKISRDSLARIPILYYVLV